MATVPQKTLVWLWDVLRREYRDTQRAYSDLAQTLAQYPSLAPRTDVYTSENGAPALLLHLNGTLPVNFRGNQYRFPVAIWIPHAYPREPPILYVTPTDDMVIRPGQHVSGSDGKIYHPYLARWREAWDRSTIVEFLRLLVDVFAREPPVMSRQQALLGSQDLPQSQSLPPRPPQTLDQRTPSARVPTAVPTPPPPPPKGNDPSSPASASAGSSAAPRPGRYDVPPPLPGQAALQRPQSTVLPPPSQNPAQYQLQRQEIVRQSYSSQQPLQSGQFQPQQPTIADSSAQMAYQQQRMAAPNSHQVPETQQFSPQRQPPMQANLYAQQQSSQPRAQQQQMYGATSQQTPQPPRPKTEQPNLMDDSPFDITLPTTNANLPTPVIPPNPEKQHILQTLSSTLLTTLQTQMAQSSSALAPLQSQFVALQAAEQILQSELAQLKTLQGQISQNVTSLDSTIKAADRTISSGQSSSSPDKIPSVDELIIPPTVVARQLYDAVAEQRSYEAAIYALTEGFVRGRIGSELWARKTRECAREDFKKKYLIKRRLGVGMGLDMSQMP